MANAGGWKKIDLPATQGRMSDMAQSAAASDNAQEMTNSGMASGSL
jgi:hypothetical protein